MTLMATDLCSTRSCARNTAPIPPWPSVASISYRPWVASRRAATMASRPMGGASRSSGIVRTVSWSAEASWVPQWWQKVDAAETVRRQVGQVRESMGAREI